MHPSSESIRLLANQPSADVRRYLDLTDAIFVQLDADGVITFVNKKGLLVLGYEFEEIIGRNWFDTCIPPTDQDTIRSVQRQLLAGEVTGVGTHQNEVITKQGNVLLIFWKNVVMRDEAGSATGTLSSGEDVTEHRRTEKRLDRAIKELHDYKFALDASAIVAITDTKGRITYVNDKFCQISKYPRDELLGQDHRILNSGYHSKAFFRNLWNTIRAGRVWRGDIRNRAKDGSTYWVSTTIVPFLDEHGEPERYIAIRYEITERKLAESALERTVRDLALAREQEAQRAEALTEARDHLEAANRRIREEQAKLIQAEKLSSIGLLASGVAHEINNPLSGVMACVKALAEGKVRDERREEYMATAREGLDRIQQIVRGLLDYSRQRAPSRSLLDAAEVVDASERLIAPFVRKKTAEIHCQLKPGEVSISADRSQLMQAIINVLLNAVYASPTGSTILVDAPRAEGRIGIRIKDQGPGMPEEVIRKACDPFFTTKPEGEGTGLGLAVTLSIVRAHGGDLEFDCSGGNGTAVTIWLPVEGTHESSQS